MLTKELISEDEFKISKKRIDEKIHLENINKEKYEAIISFEEKKDTQKDNLSILESVVKNIQDEDIDDLNEIFRVLLNEIVLLSKKPLNVEIKL